jgi:hypothetical protein
LYMYSRKRTCTFLQSQRQDGGSGYDRIGRDQRAERACSAQPKAPKKSGAPSRAAEKRGALKRRHESAAVCPAAGKNRSKSQDRLAEPEAAASTTPIKMTPMP